MSVLGVIGRGYSTFQLVVAIIISIGLIAGGIYLMAGDNVISGGVMIGVGILSPIAAWLRRKLIRASPELAEIAGGLDVIKVLGI